MDKAKLKSELLKGVNAKQEQAITFGNGPLLIIAGAGTGKTTVLTRRIAWLIEQGLAQPEEILAHNFT
jgi:DNA helicase-2/ATP-dependent DNA helicase PcrA